MAIKTFTAGSVLTASDTNTFLANSGLVYVKSQTVGSGVSSVTISDCFSATYDNYKIIWNGGTMSDTTAMTLQLGAVTSGYYGVLLYGTVATPGPLATSSNNTANWTYGGGGNPDQAFVNCDVLNAYSGRKMLQSSISYGATVAGAMGFHQGWTTFSTVCTSLKLQPASGTMTGGTITVYGYRKA